MIFGLDGFCSCQNPTSDKVPRAKSRMYGARRRIPPNPRKPGTTQHVSLGNLRLQTSGVLAPNMTDVVVSPRESSSDHGTVLKLTKGSNLLVTLSVRGRYVASKVLETIATRESAAGLCAFEASIVGFPMLTGNINQ